MACAIQPSRSIRPLKDSFSSISATSSGVHAAICAKVVTPFSCSFFSSAGPTPDSSLRSSAPSVDLAAAFLALGLGASSAAGASGAASALGALAFLAAGLAASVAAAAKAKPAPFSAAMIPDADAPEARMSVTRTSVSCWRWPLVRLEECFRRRLTKLMVLGPLSCSTTSACTPASATTGEPTTGASPPIIKTSLNWTVSPAFAASFSTRSMSPD
mmetsp:Transcript_28769/g.54587  ORF Transcript_28769/g.54587 Transcript_28769/m.54587 type:complete len:215 (+) Transcript_28769:387-1031(+)